MATKKASKLLEESAGPFDDACMIVREQEARIELAQKALHALGMAYRHDWSDFDGRQLLTELSGISAILSAETGLPSFSEWLDKAGIQPTGSLDNDYEWL